MTTKYEAGAQCIVMRAARWLIGYYESETVAQEQALRFARVMEGCHEGGEWDPIVREVTT